MTTQIAEDIKLDEKIKKEIQEPGKYNVIFLNDDHTPMDFVVELLVIIFKHSKPTAESLTLDVHEKGSAIAGCFSFEIAEQKTTEATLCARQQGFPLNIKIERAT